MGYQLMALDTTDGVLNPGEFEQIVNSIQYSEGVIRNATEGEVLENARLFLSALMNRNMQLLDKLFNSCKFSDRICSGLVNIFIEMRQEGLLISYLMLAEINDCESAEMVFREKDRGKCMGTYFQAVTKDVLEPFIAQSINLIMDTEENGGNIEEVFSKILQEFIKCCSGNKKIRRILITVAEIEARRFKYESMTSVISLLFLRFLSPSILNPEILGIEVTNYAINTAKLVTRLIQKCVNFKADIQGDMNKYADVIVANREKVGNFLNQLQVQTQRNVARHPPPPPPRDIEQVIKSETSNFARSVDRLRSFALSNFDSIFPSGKEGVNLDLLHNAFKINLLDISKEPSVSFPNVGGPKQNISAQLKHDSKWTLSFQHDELKSSVDHGDFEMVNEKMPNNLMNDQYVVQIEMAYLNPFQKEKTLKNLLKCAGMVIRSKNRKYPIGQLVAGLDGWTTMAILTESDRVYKVDVELGLEKWIMLAQSSEVICCSYALGRRTISPGDNVGIRAEKESVLNICACLISHAEGVPFLAVVTSESGSAEKLFKHVVYIDEPSSDDVDKIDNSVNVYYEHCPPTSLSRLKDAFQKKAKIKIFTASTSESEDDESDEENDLQLSFVRKRKLNIECYDMLDCELEESLSQINELGKNMLVEFSDDLFQDDVQFQQLPQMFARLHHNHIKKCCLKLKV